MAKIMKTVTITDSNPIRDYKNGRWLCRNYRMAQNCAEDHPNDYIYVYSRDSDNNMVDITLAYDPHAAQPQPPKLRGGKIIGILPSELDDK